MKKERNCGGAPYPIYPMYPGMMGQFGMPIMSQNYMMQDQSSGTIEQQLTNINNQITNLERRISNLESLIGNTTKYNNTNYQVM